MTARTPNRAFTAQAAGGALEHRRIRAREGDCGHLPLLAALGLVRRRAHTLIHALPATLNDPDAVEAAADLQAALNGTTNLTDTDTQLATAEHTIARLDERLQQLGTAARAVLDVLTDPDLPDRLTYLSGRQQVRDDLYAAASDLQTTLDTD